MVRHFIAFAIVAWGALGLSFSDSRSSVRAYGDRDRDPGGCGGTESPSSGINAPCTRTKDCGRSLVCVEGVCTEPDAVASERDASPSGSGPEDGG